LKQYGSLEALQATFGAGPPLGDLTPEETRRLYHSLLPRSLLGLHEMELLNPEELAPLAYKARIAAKEYARSRCIWTGRLATYAFDQYRNLRDRGRFGSSSLTWEEIWEKYEAQIMMEEENAKSSNGKKEKETLSMRVYLRILERSCETNKAFDSLFLTDADEENDRHFGEISSKLENDVRYILLRPKESASIERRQQKEDKKRRETKEKEDKKREKAKKKNEKKQQKHRMKTEKGEQNIDENI